MPRLPIVAIIGRPNTGKSTLFNRLIGTRKSIESDIPGTTRDHISHRVVFGDIPAILLDTGGIGASRDVDFEENVRAQSLLALEHADVILLTINSTEELTSDDRAVIDAVRKKRRKNVALITVLTKVDTPGSEHEKLSEYSEAAIGDEVIAVSAPHRKGLQSLSKQISKALAERHFASEEAYEETSTLPRIAIIGKPNVGKSSVVNAMMSSEQQTRSPLVVSDIAGTTRDATDTVVTYHGRSYTLVDTAGLKKHKMSLDEIERFSMMRTISAIEQSDIVILVLDAKEVVSQQDKKIAALAIEHGKGIIILLNKMDTLSGAKRVQKVQEVAAAIPFCSKFAKIIPCSAKTKEGLAKIFDVIDAVALSRTRRISVRELRRWFDQMVHGQPVGAVAKTKHITQAKDIPPTFVLFLNNPKAVKVSQLRYMENRLRETFGFDGTPIRWITKPTQKDTEE
ncbi:MAG: ribosome biogenesis GTPase Der [Candidatus Peribacteraceae bacterium]